MRIPKFARLRRHAPQMLPDLAHREVQLLQRTIVVRGLPVLMSGLRDVPHSVEAVENVHRLVEESVAPRRMASSARLPLPIAAEALVAVQNAAHLVATVHHSVVVSVVHSAEAAKVHHVALAPRAADRLVSPAALDRDHRLVRATAVAVRQHVHRNASLMTATHVLQASARQPSVGVSRSA